MPSFTKFLALVSATTSLATAFKIPKGQPDGIYLANLDTNDVTPLNIPTTYDFIHATRRRGTRRDTAAATAAAAAEVLKAPRTIPLPVTESGCGSGAELNIADYIVAYADFASYCDAGGWIPGRSVLYRVVGSAVWYGCSYGDQQPCSSLELSDAESRFNEKCGVAQAGWVWMADWAKTYGRESVATADICGNLKGKLP